MARAAAVVCLEDNSIAMSNPTVWCGWLDARAHGCTQLLLIANQPPLHMRGTPPNDELSRTLRSAFFSAFGGSNSDGGDDRRRAAPRSARRRWRCRRRRAAGEETVVVVGGQERRPRRRAGIQVGAMHACPCTLFRSVASSLLRL
jgi:hypothetical protein